MVNQSAMWPFMAIYNVVTSFIVSNAQYHSVPGLKMDEIVVVQEAVVGTSLVIFL
jgi:hypothetical protein